MRSFLFAYLFMANNYSDGMPDGLTFKSEEQKQLISRSSAEDAMSLFKKMAPQLVAGNEDLQEEFKELLKSQQKLVDRFDQEQKQRLLDAKLLKEKGASDEEVVAYLTRRQDLYEKDTKALFNSFSSLGQQMSEWIENSDKISGEERILLRKQLDTFQKSYDIDYKLKELYEQEREEEDKDKKNRNKVLDRIEESVRGTWKEALEKSKAEKKGALSSLASSVLGPLRLIADPISKLTTGETTKELVEGFFDKWEESKEEEESDEEALLEKRDKELEQALENSQQPMITAVNEIKGLLEDSLEDTMTPEGAEEFIRLTNSVPDQEDIPVISETNFGVAEDEGILQDTSPVESELLRKGGVVGAAAVFLGKALGRIEENIDDIDPESSEDDKSLLEEITGGNFKKALTKVAPTLASIAGVAAVAAVPAALLRIGNSYQERDTEDAKKYVEEGNYGRAFETALLGDRERLTEENANYELGRATKKNALLAGGAAGGIALATGGISAGMAAGAAASATGASLAGAGLAAAGATAGAVFPPLLIAAAIGAAATVVAKGTQEAFELGWDKNQAEIQKNLYDVIYSEDSSIWEKVKADFTSGWREFTGTIAGGIRASSEEIENNAAVEYQRGIEYLEKSAKEGNAENARLLSLMRDEEFKALSDNDKEMILKAEGLFDEYNTMLEESQFSFGESLINGMHVIGDFFKGAADTSNEAAKGKIGAAIDAELLKHMDELSGDDIERLKTSTEYLEAAASGKNQLESMQAAYLAEKHRENAALGITDENGMAITRRDYAITFRGKKSDEDYRQSREYSQTKAKLMMEGYTSEEADLKAIEDYNELYDQALTLRLKQTKDYREYYKKALKEGKSTVQAEKEALNAAKENKRNTMTTTELIKDTFTEMGKSIKENFNTMKEKVSEGFNAFKESEFVTSIENFANGIWEKVSEWFGRLGDWFSEKWDKVTSALSGAWDATKEGAASAWNATKEGVSSAGEWLGEKATNVWDWFTGKTPADAQIDDGIVTKEGKVIQLSPEDNVYATKNLPQVVGDADAQRAMPRVEQEKELFSDSRILAAIEVLTDVLRGKNTSPEITISENATVGFEQFRSA